MTNLLTALSRLPNGITELTPAQTRWMAAQLGDLTPQARHCAGQTWRLVLEDERGETASCSITLQGDRGAVAMVLPMRHIDFQSSQEVEIIAPPATPKTSNGGRAIAADLIARAQALRATR